MIQTHDEEELIPSKDTYSYDVIELQPIINLFTIIYRIDSS